MKAAPDPATFARFQAATGLSADAIPLAEAALLISGYLGPGCDTGLPLQRIEALAADLRARWSAPAAAAELSPAEVRWGAEALATLLHEETGLRGNADDYYDPRNSHLDLVLERGLGLPITLSIVYMEVARRAGLPAVGLGFPGHFLVGLGPDAARVVVDPFHGGRLLTRGDLVERVRQQLGPDAPLDPAYLRPVTHRQLLVRLLNNLKAIHARAGQDALTLRVLDLLLALVPGLAEERRDRGLLRARLRQPAAALEDLEFYLARRPEAEDTATLRGVVERLRVELARWN